MQHSNFTYGIPTLKNQKKIQTWSSPVKSQPNNEEDLWSLRPDCTIDAHCKAEELWAVWSSQWDAKINEELTWRWKKGGAMTLWTSTAINSMWSRASTRHGTTLFLECITTRSRSSTLYSCTLNKVYFNALTFVAPLYPWKYHSFEIPMHPPVPCQTWHTFRLPILCT